MAVEERLRQLLIDLADQMIDKDIKNIKFKQKIPPGKKEKITEALELWDYFEKIGRIDFKDERRTVASLKRIVDVGASSVGLVRFVQRYEARYLTDLSTQEPDRPETTPERHETMDESQETMEERQATMAERPDIMPESPETMPESQKNMPESQETMKERQETMPESPEFMPERQNNMPERTETMPQATGIDVTTSLTETSLTAVARTTLHRRTSLSTLPFLATRRNYLPPLPVPCPVSLPPLPPQRTKSCPAQTLPDPPCQQDLLPDPPCPDTFLPTEPLPITARSSSLPQAAFPFLPPPLPLVLDLPSSAGPVCVLGPDLGSGVILARPQGLAYHAGTDRLYVACWGSGQVVTCGTRGQDPRSFYTQIRPRDVAVSWDGERVYVLAGLTPSSSLHILNSSGELVKSVDSVPGGLLGTCWSVDDRGEEVAVLSDEHGVVVFSRDGEFVTQWRLDQVEGGAMAANDDGHVYITDVKNGAVLFSDGESWTRFGDVDMDNADSSGICVGGDGHVCVSRWRAHRVDVYDRQRCLLTSLGGEQGIAPGQFSHPHGLCPLPDGRLVVAEYGNDRLQIFQI